jgi:cytochrome c biogenesis protein CcmG/thiol:disulfide interchange protein DsbE
MIQKLLILLLIISTLACGNVSEPENQTAFVQRYKDKPLPTFSLTSLDGKIINSESLKGKVVMINFWSTTCGPCILEMPQLNQLKKDYKDIVFLAPAPEDSAKIKRFLSRHSFDFVILPDSKKLFEEWGIDSYPKNFFVDQNGIVRAVKEGTPISDERDEKGKVQVMVIETYAPILSDLAKK